jgi:hypothetical protein
MIIAILKMIQVIVIVVKRKMKNKNDVFILTVAAVEFVENYYMSYIVKEPCRTSSQTGYK